MAISKLALPLLLGSALVAFGCTSDGGGSGGNGGNGGDTCEPVEQRCENATIDPIEPCCVPDAPPVQENACDGTETLENPDNCDATGTTVTHQLTVFALDGDCNSGFDLDGCDGTSCVNGTINPRAEGIAGVDNGLASSAPNLRDLGENLDAVQQAFSNSLCGMSDDASRGTCEGGDNPGDPCTASGGGGNGGSGGNGGNGGAGGSECMGAGATCNFSDNDCLMEISAIDITFEVDANLEQNCANVTVKSGDVSSDVILNLGTPTATQTVCASGTIGDLPVVIENVDATLGNAVVRMTVSADGFSDGLLGVTADEDTATTIASALPDPASQLVALLFDINDDLSGDTTTACNALSLTLSIGGVAVQ